MAVSLVDFISEIGQAAAIAQIAAIRQSVETLLKGNDLDVTIPVGADRIIVDGAGLLPDGLPALKRLKVECETTVDSIGGPKPGIKGVAPNIKMKMKKGLFKRGVDVKIEAEFVGGQTLEALEIVREHANHLIEEQAERLRE